MKHDREIEILKHGGIGVIPTDTLYGIVGSAVLPNAVERIYRIKKRNTQKPLIVLLSSIDDLKKFGINNLTEENMKALGQYWPGPTSILLPCVDSKFEYLHRDTGSVAFRLPDKKDLIDLLRETGPLVAPSANLEGEKPAATIAEARTYFGDEIDFYIDGGELNNKPSSLLQIIDGKVIKLR